MMLNIHEEKTDLNWSLQNTLIRLVLLAGSNFSEFSE